MADVLPATPASIARAADLIRGGGLVAFPTETVYGLGANALDSAAVARIFVAKGRPATNPVIVHVASFDEAIPLITETTPIAKTLAERFWPGPLTLVLPRASIVPEIVTAGGPTVGIRVPAHPVARDLLKAAGVPIAAPSANRSTCLSPTRPEHVLRGLAGRIDMLLDGGPCSGGLESTVVDLTTQPPTLLRPGLVGVRELEAAVGPIQRRATTATIARSPGQMSRHYSPTTPMEFATDDGRANVVAAIERGVNVGWLTFGPAQPATGVRLAEMPTTPREYAARLFDALHDLDEAKLGLIVVALPPEDDDWLAIHDRLSRMKRDDGERGA